MDKTFILENVLEIKRCIQAMEREGVPVAELADLKAALDRFTARNVPDPTWCYYCDRPKNDCACSAEEGLCTSHSK
jgi:hypothetical protein